MGCGGDDDSSKGIHKKPGVVQSSGYGRDCGAASLQYYLNLKQVGIAVILSSSLQNFWLHPMGSKVCCLLFKRCDLWGQDIASLLGLQNTANLYYNN